MGAAVDEVLAELETRQAEEDALIARLPPEEVGRRRDALSVSIGRSTGILLNLLVRESGARAILELGTSFGYSTIWLADAARCLSDAATPCRAIGRLALNLEVLRRGLAAI